MVISDVLSKMDWRRELSGDEREVCSLQGNLFELCQYKLKCDPFEFIEKFMESETAHDMDDNYIDYCELDPFEFVQSMGNKIQVSISENKKYHEALFWTGYVYRYWSYMGLTSKEIIRIFPVEAAYEAYKGLHTLSVKEAIRIYVERWMKHYVKDSA